MKRLIALSLGCLWLALAGAAGAQDKPDKKQVPAYIATLKNAKASDKAKEDACKGLYEVGRIKAAYIKDAVEPLIMLVKKEESAKVRTEAARALGAADPEDAKDTVEALIERVKEDKETNVKAAAIIALGLLGAKAKSALPAMKAAAEDARKAAADDKDNKQKAQAAKTIGKAVQGATKQIQAEIKGS